MILLIALLSMVTGEEPRCSKYDFEEKVLEKLIRMEFKMEQLQSEMLDATNTVRQMKHKVEQNVDTLETKAKSLEERLTELDSIKDQMRKDFQSELHQLKESNGKNRVVFKARSDGNMNVQHGQTLVFPVLIVNEGNGYDVSSGIFTAPVDGTYIFTAAFCVISGKSLTFAILIDGRQYSGSLFYNYNCYSADAVGLIKAGQRVSVQAVSGGHTGTDVIFHQASYAWNTFSGALVNA